MYKVYLSGAITGLTYDAGNDWRVKVTEQLEWNDHMGAIGMPLRRRSLIECLNPMRAHEFLRTHGVILDGHGADDPNAFLVTDEFIGARDAWDTMRADAIFVNLLGATRVSIGTVLEIGMAHAKRVPVILVMEDKGNLHEHAMIRNYTTMRFNSLDKAVIATKALFSV